MKRWVIASFVLWLGPPLALLRPQLAHSADLSLQAVLGEEIAANGLLDVGETVTVSAQLTYAPGEQAVNYQLDLAMAGGLSSFAATALPPSPFGSPGDANCAVISADRLRCFGNVDLLANSTTRVTQADSPVALGSFQILATGANAALQIAPVITFSQELVADSQNPALLMVSVLPLTVSGLDASGNVVDLTSATPPLDSDGDGILDDGDFSGVVGDAPCASGQSAGCDDNCPFTANLSQADVGGVATPTSSANVADGIGDACQCGDVNDNGEVNSADSILIRKQLLGLNPIGFLAPQKCNVKGVAGPADCDAVDATTIRKNALGLPSGFSQVCAPALP